MTAGLDNAHAIKEQIQERVQAVLDDASYWFPLRHHSPKCAHELAACMRARKPAVLFLELPSCVQSLLPHVLETDTQAPVACYLAYRQHDGDEGKRAAWWIPLLDYSPELVAIKTAAELGIPVVCMDLPPYHLLADDDEDDVPQLPDLASSTQGSSYFQALATAGDYHSFDEAWDVLFETSPQSGEAFRQELLQFCAGARLSATGALASDGTLPRERYMWQCIQTECEKRGLARDQTMIACGGFHCFLDQQDELPPPVAPAGHQSATIVPYSFKRLASQTGYAAGNRAPQFYDSCWQLRNADSDAVLAEQAVQLVRAARAAGVAVSPADSLAVTSHASMLAQLRGRWRPVLDDLCDAMLSCCCKGDPTTVGRPLLQALQQATIGDRIGCISSTVDTLPIVADFKERLHQAGLADVLQQDAVRVCQLRLHDAAARQTSALLHCLVYLGLPFASLRSQPDALQATLFREDWQLAWSPELEPRLVECSHYGDTVARAASALLVERLAQPRLGAGEACTLLLHADRMDLGRLFARVLHACRQALEQDDRFVSLAQATRASDLLAQRIRLRGLDTEQIELFREQAFLRAALALREAGSAPEDEHVHVFEGLRAMAEISLDAEKACDRQAFAGGLEVAQQHAQVAVLRGAFLGLRTELRLLDVEELSQAVQQLARSSLQAQLEAGDLLYGILVMSPVSISLGPDRFVAAVSELFAAVDWDAFKHMLPRLRQAFEQLSRQDHARVVATVSGAFGLQEDAVLTMQTSSKHAADLAAVDARVQAILEAWS